ncbi:MAG: hypothetical protein CVU42_00185 [Chloroflexi bacterium HGW-Chloroflexi-4]|jgi:5-methylcytosine-specific restriction enzyme subunit McrC|nr:MAG: hypothetical protein CVU42_00185 [Chloroflexi bacterium HGW-Chloroflexi-4]
MQIHYLDEWELKVVPEELLPEDEKLINQLKVTNRLEVDSLKEGTRIKAKSWVGVIQFTNFQVQIIPKLAGMNLGLVDMLMYTTGINALRRFNSRRYIEVNQQGNLLDLIIWLLCDECETILSGGLLYDYEGVEESLLLLKGRLLIDKQIRRRFGQIDKLECAYDDHSSNIPENQLLEMALFRAQKITEDEVIRNRVRRLWDIFSSACQINSLDFKETREAIHYSRLNAHYEEAHGLAEMIMFGLGIDDIYKSDKRKSFTFLLDMNRLFEQFLFRYLTEILKGSNLDIDYQHKDRSIIRYFDTGKSYSQVIPDFLVKNNQTSNRFPIDAKYKLYDDRKIDPGDIAQIFLYAYAFDQSTLPTAMLIYPTCDPSANKVSMVIKQSNQVSGAKIHVMGLNIQHVLEEIQKKNYYGCSDLLLYNIQQVYGF